MIAKSLYKDADHEWVVLARDPERKDQIVDTNEYVIVSRGDAILIDPGGTEVFPSVLQGLAKLIELDQIKAFFASHQDPDVMSSLPLWMELCPQATTYMSWLWKGFIAHFGVEYVDRFVTIPDSGGSLPIGRSGRSLEIVPAHYLHSSGNFSLYDPLSKILFSGDIGAALLPSDHNDLFVADFDRHIAYMHGFHTRWMPSNAAKERWIRRIRKLDVAMICPQHGAIFRGEDVGRFLDWFEALEVGIDRSDLAEAARL